MTSVSGSSERGRVMPAGLAALGGATRGRARQAPGERAAEPEDLWAVRVEIVQRRPSQAPAAPAADIIDVSAEPVPQPCRETAPESQATLAAPARTALGFEAPDALRAAAAYRAQAALARGAAAPATLGLR